VASQLSPEQKAQKPSLAKLDVIGFREFKVSGRCSPATRDTPKDDSRAGDKTEECKPHEQQSGNRHARKANRAGCVLPPERLELNLRLLGIEHGPTSCLRIETRGYAYQIVVTPGAIHSLPEGVAVQQRGQFPKAVHHDPDDGDDQHGAA
jgi:hypothetical protein